LEGLSESRKKSGGFPFGGTVDDVMARKQMTVSNFILH
jgi:hypothetical protein